MRVYLLIATMTVLLSLQHQAPPERQSLPAHGLHDNCEKPHHLQEDGGALHEEPDGLVIACNIEMTGHLCLNWLRGLAPNLYSQEVSVSVKTCPRMTAKRGRVRSGKKTGTWPWA